MGVFDGQTKIGRRVVDPLTDKKLPLSGALSWGSITTTTALAGTTGLDCKLVHGDRWQEIGGKMTEHYTDNVKSTFDQNWTILVSGIMSLTVVKGYNESQQGPVNREYVQVVTDLFDSDHNVTIPDSASFSSLRYNNTWVELTQIQLTGLLAAAAVIGCCITLTGILDLEFKILHAEGHPLHFAWAGNDTTASISTEHFAALRAAVGTAAKTEATVNALLDLDTGTPLT
jgi:hypothetical protein